MLADVWAELLQVEQVGRRDNFFSLGGHSLQAVRVVTRIRQGLGVAMTVADLFAQPVLADLAHRLEGAARAELPAIVRTERGQWLPLSFAQQRLWFLAQIEEAGQAYHVPMGLHLKGELDAEALRRALDRIVARHEALRTTFCLHRRRTPAAHCLGCRQPVSSGGARSAPVSGCERGTEIVFWPRRLTHLSICRRGR